MIVLTLAASALAQQYRFGTSPEDYGAFYPTAYYDHGGVDWACGGITYSGHRGNDFGGGGFDGMYAGRDLVAAADGTVVTTNDGEFDACTTGDCAGGSGFGNYVKLQHADGKVTYYAHMKQWSVAVSVGQYVTCGQKLGEMGSSGYSTGPHLHFEVRDAGNTALDPFSGGCAGGPSYWVDQGAYAALPGLVCEGPVAPCATLDLLTCGASVAAANNMGGSTTDHYYYGSCVEYTYTGPEVAWRVRTNLAEPVTVSVTGNSADVDLLVLDHDACDGTGCIGASVSPNADAESVTFNANADQEYVVVVDGWEGAVTNFTLSVACTGSLGGDDPPEDTAPPVDTAPPEDTAETGDDPRPPRPNDDDPPIPPMGDEDLSEGQRLAADEGGCGCTSSGSGGAAAVAAGLLLLRARRRPKR